MGGSYAVEITPLDYSNRSFGRRVANLRRSWVWLFRLHDRRRLRLSRAARRMEPGRLDTACHAKGHDHGQSRRSETRAQNTPILAHLGALIRDPSKGFTQFSDAQKTLAAAIGGGFVGLFSLFNIGGRFFWATLSDKIGRKTTYFVFFGLGVVCYATAHTLADLKAVVVSRPRFPSSPRCTAADLPPCRPISLTCSERDLSARYMAVCSRRGRRRGSWAR